VADWILSQQVDDEAEAQEAASLSGRELFAGNCARCHGEDGRSGGGRPGPSLVGVFERHSDETVLAILQNGIYLGTGVTMPPWQNGYFYPTSPDDGGPARYDDQALRKIVNYLERLQPDELPDDAGQYNTPGVGEDEAGQPSSASSDEGEA
jgi:mono/diheme cytochrome c family protein